MALINPFAKDIDIEKIDVAETINQILYHNNAPASTSIKEEKLRKVTDRATLLEAAKMVRSSVALIE